MRDRFDEDEVPVAAAVLAALTDAVPAHAAEGHRAGHAGQLAWRAAALVVIVLLAYLPTVLSGTLPEGEAAALGRGPPRWPTGADRFVVPAVVRYPAGVPWPLAVLVRAEAHGGESVAMRHAIGVGLHGGVAVLLWLVLRRTGRPAAWLAAAAWAAWPGSAAAVEWVGQRGRPYAAGLAVAGVWLLLRSADVPPREIGHTDGNEDDDDHPPPWWGGPVAVAAAVAGVTLLLAAVLCQPTVAGVGLIGVVLVAWRRGLRRADLAWAVPAVGLAVVATVAVVRAMPAVPRTPFGHDPVAAMPAVARAAWQTGRTVQRLWPTTASDLATPGTSPVPTALLGTATWALLIAVIVFRRRLGAAAAVGAIAFALLLPTALVPPAVTTVGVPPPPGNPAAAYLLVVVPLVAAADALLAACRRVRDDLRQRSAEVAAAAVGLLALVGATVGRAWDYRDSDGLLSAFVVVDEQSWSSRSLLAGHRLRAGDPAGAQAALAGLQLDVCPDATTAVAEGDVLAAVGDVAAALPWYDRADRLDPTDPTAVIHRAIALLRLGRPGDAIDNYVGGVARHPTSADLREAFGVMLDRQGDTSAAIEQYRAALAIDPDRAVTHVALAISLIRRATASGGANPARDALLTDAFEHLRRAIELDPENADAFHTAGQTSVLMGAFEPAVQLLTEAVRRRDDWPEAYNDLGVALIDLARGRTRPAALPDRRRLLRRAQYELEEAVRLRPDYADAKANLTVARRELADAQRRANVTGP